MFVLIAVMKIAVLINLNSIQMKKKKWITIVSVFLLLMLSVSACDKCKNSVCLNGGECLDGTCICPDGYVGTHCETYVGSGGGGSGGGGGGGNSTGNVSFWNDDVSIGTITVNVSSYSGSVTSNVDPSSCNTSGCANFTLQVGTYSYTASATTGETWSGTCTISSGGCLLYHLY